MFDSAPLKPVTLVPVAMMPGAVMHVNVTVHINLTVVDPVRFSVLVKR